LLIVVQFRQPTGHNIACIRFGYNDKKKSSATDGGENLSSIPDSDGIGFKAKLPVTLYPKGMLTCTGSACYSFCIKGKPSKVNPRKISLNIRHPGTSPGYLNYVAASGVFVLAIKLPYIQKICAPYTVAFHHLEL